MVTHDNCIASRREIFYRSVARECMMCDAELLLSYIENDDVDSLEVYYEMEQVSFEKFISTPIVALHKNEEGCVLLQSHGVWESKSHFEKNNRDVISASLMLKSQKIVQWILDSSCLQEESPNPLLPHRICHKLVDISATCGESSDDTKLEEEVCEFYCKFKNHSAMQECLRVENEDGYLAMEYAVIREQYSLALAYFNTEGVHCRVIEGVHYRGYRVVEYDIKRYTRRLSYAINFSKIKLNIMFERGSTKIRPGNYVST